MVVQASAEENSRRAVLAGLLGAAALAGARPALAADIFDDRKVRQNGFDIIYEARDLDLPQNVRDGMTQARSNVADTKKRISESEKRVDTKLGEFVNKQYWTSAREELRLQLGTLRFDLNSLASNLEKPKRKAADEAKKAFYAKADELDYAIRKKDLAAAQSALAAARSALDGAIAAVA